MEGILHKFEPGVFGEILGGTWRECFFVLHEDILRIMDYPSKKRLIGQMHLKITKISKVGGGGENANGVQQEACEFVFDCGGLFNVRVRAPSVAEYVEWSNALSNA